MLNSLSFVLCLYLCRLLKIISLFSLRKLSLVVYSFYSSMPDSASIVCVCVCEQNHYRFTKIHVIRQQGIMEGFLANAKCWLPVLCVCLLIYKFKYLSVCYLLGTG